MAHALHPVRALTPEPVTGDQRVSSTEFSHLVGTYLWRVSRGQQRFIVMTHNRPTAALIPIEELERLRDIEREWRGQCGEESP